MKLLCLLLLLALSACADGTSNAPGEPGSANVRLNGVYTVFGGYSTAR